MSLTTLNLIGPGRLGLSLARLWHDIGQIQLGGIATRADRIAAIDTSSLGIGITCPLAELPQADITMIATPDDALAHVALALAKAGPSIRHDIVFHCSGALSSGVLAPLAEKGAAVASIHPLRSFTGAALSLAEFAGTYCGCEGDEAALARLAPLFDAIGARRFAVDAAHKTHYHAAAVLACNDLVALMEAALQCMEAAGVDRTQAWPALRPLIDGTLNNLDALGTRAALTGPVARGDADTVARQTNALQDLSPHLGDTYRSLGMLALELSGHQEERRLAIAKALGAQP
jgi:predicted short-subunit dehydrogenase-like oxidoreductase (DUF2520 family)